jgi:hypothetical protein
MPEALIETAIGLFFVFLLMSLVSSQIVEWIASYRGWRAKELEKAIRAMLRDPVIQKNLDQEALVLADKLYEHPLIASLARPGHKPSYIPAGKFALALFDVLLTAGTEVSTIGRARVGLEQVKNHFLNTLPASAERELEDLIEKIQKLIDDARAVSSTPAEIAGLSLPPGLNDELNGFFKRYSIPQSTVNALVQPLMADSELQLTQILNAVLQLAKSRPQLSQLVTSLFSSMDTYLSQGESRLSAARRTVEQWFDDAMDRTSGWYKRSTQLWLGLVGLVLACALNVDAITVATALWRDPTLRQNALEQAQKYQLASTGESTPFSSIEDAVKAIRELNAQLSQELQLPIGWHTQVYALESGQTCVLLPQRVGDVWGIPSQAGCLQLKEAPSNQSAGPLAKILGLLLTAIAVSQGAPFWFDVLSKLSNPRGSGPVPASSQEKAKEKAEEKSRVEILRTVP